MKNILLILLVILTIPLSISSAYATESEIISGNDNLIVEEYDFCVQQTCSGHPSFISYIVREDGLFAVYYLTTANTEARVGNIFSNAYIDIFNEEGEFLAEISLRTRDEVTLNFSSNSLDIYLAERMLSVDLSTYEVTQKQTPRYYAKENGLHAKFREKTQEVNGWRYYCKGTSMKYTKLIRKNAHAEETLLSLSGDVPGTHMSYTTFVIKGISGGALLIAVGLIWKAHTVKNKRQAK